MKVFSMNQRRTPSQLASGLLALVVAFGCALAPLAPAGAAASSATDLVVGGGYVGSTPISGPTDFSSALSSEGEPVVGVAVKLRATSYDGTVTERSGTTDAYGEVTVRIPVLTRSTMQWFYAGTDEFGPSTSTPFVWRVRPRMGISLNDRTLLTGQRLVVTGGTYPGRAGHVVKLWSGSAPRSAPSSVPYIQPVLLARGVTRADGSYRLVRTFANPAGRLVFVTVSPGNGTERGWTAERAIRVRAR